MTRDQMAALLADVKQYEALEDERTRIVAAQDEILARWPALAPTPSPAKEPTKPSAKEAARSRAKWLPASVAANMAKVTPQAIGKWGSTKKVRRIGKRGSYRYLRTDVERMVKGAE